MKRLTDRWGFMRVSAAALIAVVALGVTASYWPTFEPFKKDMDCARFSRVFLMGLSVANPDYYVNYHLEPAAECDESSFAGSMRIGISPRLPESGLTGSPMLYATIRQDSPEVIDVPRLEPWKLTEALIAFGDETAEARNREVIELLRGLNAFKFHVQAVIELENPLNEEEVRGLHDIGIGEVALFSPGDGRKPIGWPFPYPCTVGVFDLCGDKESKSRVGEFRRWVSMLRPEDAPALEEFGLDLSNLQRRAQDGLIYGFTINNTAEAVTALAKNPKVRSVRVIEITPSGS
ncbi:hypothetical protein OHA77_02895 [Streptosporangium sp. NBC_01639]|uniref:hypothetical protein n=1 Tax=Streptosporangium sp. NBC_01639 TaxID=2975948 RepID=UPI00386C1645|nr:hypothetical protein OHA77_02895 [Streptosporangium sp. NBC_01639]